MVGGACQVGLDRVPARTDCRDERDVAEARSVRFLGQPGRQEGGIHEVGGEVDNGFVHPSTHRDLRLVQHPRDVEHPLSGFTVLDERIGLGEGACRYGITHGNAQSPDRAEVSINGGLVFLCR